MGEAIISHARAVLTGGGYGFRLDQSLALAMVRPESPYDPENGKLHY